MIVERGITDVVSLPLAPLLAAGAPGEIIENENVRRVYLGEHFRM